MGNDIKLNKVQIVIHCLPREIDHLERICNTLRENYLIIENEIEIILDVTLNLNSNFTNWENSQIPKQFFIQKFNVISNLHKDWAKINFIIDEEEKCLGINDKRRNSINDNIEADYLMYLDLDVFFPFLTLFQLNNLIKSIDCPNVIISSEVVQLWDNSWDGLVNKYFKGVGNEYFKTVDPYMVNRLAVSSFANDELSFRENNPIKFGGGWVNTFSKQLLKFINIPDSLGSYGLDDTFVMTASNIMKNKGYDIKQYVMEGIVCIENNYRSLYDFNPYEDLIDDLSFKNKGREFKKYSKEKSHLNYNNEMQNFIDRI